MSYPLATIAFTVFGLLLWYWKRSQARPSLAHLPGPPPGSWLVGNNPSFERPNQAFEADFEWTEKYGSAFRIKGYFGEDILYLSDPKAMQYIFNKAGYNFPKTWEARMRSSLATDRGITFVEGAQHARQRRVMNASFTHSAYKGFVPLFFGLSQKMVATWKARIRKQNAEVSILNVSPLLACTTLEAIGEAAFGYKFNAIESTEPTTELHKAYQNLFSDAYYMPSDTDLLIGKLLTYAPLWIWNILSLLPRKDLQRLTNYLRVARKLAKELVAGKMQAHAQGKEIGKDVMSIFVKANNAEDPKRRLEEEEILPQITTMLLAGHETTATSVSWCLHELSKQPDVQRKLRDEVRTIRADVISRGESELTVSDLDSMQYMLAVETLRYYPIILKLSREAGHDDVIPLSIPQRTVTGDTITSIPVRKGQAVHMALPSYNRLKSVWGQDADQWRPERFLEEFPSEFEKTGLGVFGNLATFSSGVRGCVGWRFAVLEMQVILMELLDNFDFSPVPDIEIRPVAIGVCQSMVKGQEHKGSQMPLTVSILSNSNGN